MRTGTCENCGAMVQLVSASHRFHGAMVLGIVPQALPGQHARPDLPVHLKACPVCGAPRDDTRTLDNPATADTVDLEC